jgi:hypothetical protein
MLVGGLNVTSYIPGRLRLKVDEVKRSPEFAQRLHATLTRVPGISRVEVNAATGSVLIHYTAAAVSHGPGRVALTQAVHELFPAADVAELRMWLDRAG